MGESEVLLCPYRYLEDNGKTRRTQNSTLLLLPVPGNSATQSYLSSCDAQWLNSTLKRTKTILNKKASCR